MDGLNVDPKYAIGQMESVRQLYDKTEGVQAHLFIQSFAPGEVSPTKANELGLELAHAISENNHYQVAIYTHNDTNHVHNHLILNAVDFETGSKYQQSFDVKRVRELSDIICQKHDLSIIQETHPYKTPIEELKAKEKGQYIWKDDLRDRITLALETPSTIDATSFRHHLKAQGVNVRYRGEGLSYDFMDDNGKKRISRGLKLGYNYGKIGVQSVFKYNAKEQATPKLSPTAQRHIEHLTAEWQKWEDRIHQGIQLEKEIAQQLDELLPHYQDLDGQIQRLKLNPTYQRYNQLSEKHKTEINQVEKGKEQFLNTKNRHIFKKAENFIGWRSHSSTLKQSTIQDELEKLKPQKQTIDKKISVLEAERFTIGTKISKLRETRNNDSNIQYKDHYRGHQRKLAYEIDCWKSPGYEQELERREEHIIANRMEQSRGMSL